DLLGVRVLAAPPGAQSPVGREVESRDAAPFSSEPGETAATRSAGAAARLVYDGPDMTLFERPGAFPRVWLVSGARPGGVEEARAAAREPLAGSVFRRAADAARRGGSGPAPGPARVLRLSRGRFSVETESPAGALLASSQKIYPPYWRISVDGVRTAALAGD